MGARCVVKRLKLVLCLISVGADPGLCLLLAAAAVAGALLVAPAEAIRIPSHEFTGGMVKGKLRFAQVVRRKNSVRLMYQGM